MKKINYDNRKFTSIRNSVSGEVGSDTIFHYHQKDELVWAEYKGGEIVFGHLIAKCSENGILDMRYHHLNSRYQLMTGTCRSTPEVLSDGRIRLHEQWQWTCGDLSKGESIIEEIIDQAPRFSPEAS